MRKTNRNKEIDVSLVENEPKNVEKFFQGMSIKKGFKYATGLPDCESNYLGKVNSAVASFGERVMPEFLPNVINCGMALMKLNISHEVIKKNSREIISTIHKDLINERWTPTSEQNEEILEKGAKAFSKHFMPEKLEQLNCMLDGGESNVNSLIKDKLPISEVVPRKLLLNKDLFSFPENRIRKNHFLEFYVESNLDGTKDDSQAESTICGFHFESKFSEVLNGYYLGLLQKDIRKAFIKKRFIKKITGLLRLSPVIWQKIFVNSVFHLRHRGNQSIFSIFKNYVLPTNHETFHINSVEGQKYLQAYMYAANHSTASRLALMGLVARSIEKVLGTKVEWNIVWEAGHDNFSVDHGCMQHGLVSRVGSVPVSSMQKGFIAGLYNVPSLLLRKNVSVNGSVNRWRNSYDHGMGNIQRKYQSSNKTIVVGKVHIFRPDNKYTKIKDEDITYEDVSINRGLEKVIEIYSKTDAPMHPDKLLVPFISYKWVWKNKRK